MQRRMNREELQWIHQLEQQAESIDRGDRGRFSTHDDNINDYLNNLIVAHLKVKESQNVNTASMGSRMES